MPDSYHGECEGGIIQAHTVPKQSLKAIARDGHVYCLKFDLADAQCRQDLMKLDLKGVNKATTFSGFCKKHDNSLFAPIEKLPFQPCDEHCFLLLYRTFARELYCKRNAASLIDTTCRTLDRGKELSEQQKLQRLLGDLGYAHKKGLSDLQAYGQKFAMSMKNKDFSSVKALAIELDDAPPIMGSGGTYPIYDFKGNKLQDLIDPNKLPSMLSLTSFFDSGKGWIVFVWDEHASPICEQVVHSLLSKKHEQILPLALQYLAKSIENISIDPDWWDALNQNVRSSFIRLAHDSVSFDEDFNHRGMISSFIGSKLPKIIDIVHV